MEYYHAARGFLEAMVQASAQINFGRSSDMGKIYTPLHMHAVPVSFRSGLLSGLHRGLVSAALHLEGTHTRTMDVVGGALGRLSKQSDGAGQELTPHSQAMERGLTRNSGEISALLVTHQVLGLEGQDKVLSQAEKLARKIAASIVLESGSLRSA
jgi:hypothetical protein